LNFGEFVKPNKKVLPGKMYAQSMIDETALAERWRTVFTTLQQQI
jgi:hypothetical protein